MKRTALDCVSDTQLLAMTTEVVKWLGYTVDATGCARSARRLSEQGSPCVALISADLAPEILERLDEDLTHVVILGDDPAFVLSRELGVQESQCLSGPVSRADIVNALAWAATRPVAV